MDTWLSAGWERWVGVLFYTGNLILASAKRNQQYTISTLRSDSNKSWTYTTYCSFI